MGLPSAFCRRMGVAVYEVDYREWTDLAAHAQRERGHDRCTAADAAMARIDRLARAMVADAHTRDFEKAAVDLGRALHTLQDECAHHGMTNEEHAYYSLYQLCTSEQTSPDVQADAIACADSRTRSAIAVAAAALVDVRWDGVEYICRDSENNDSCATAVLPTPGMACDFLKLHSAWDGRDSRWNGDIVGGALGQTFSAAAAGETTSRSICSGDVTAIDPVASHSMVADTSGGCTLSTIACLGKVDDDQARDEDAAGGGCTAAPGAGPRRARHATTPAPASLRRAGVLGGGTATAAARGRAASADRAPRRQRAGSRWFCPRRLSRRQPERTSSERELPHAGVLRFAGRRDRAAARHGRSCACTRSRSGRRPASPLSSAHAKRREKSMPMPKQPRMSLTPSIAEVRRRPTARCRVACARAAPRLDDRRADATRQRDERREPIAARLCELIGEQRAGRLTPMRRHAARRSPCTVLDAREHVIEELELLVHARLASA